MSEQPPSGPFGDEPSGRPSPPAGYGQSSDLPPGYPQPGYAPPSGSGSFDVARAVFVGAWIVLGLFVLSFFYQVSQDDYGEDFGDRFFTLVPQLGTGVFYAGVLLGISAWMSRNN